MTDPGDGDARAHDLLQVLRLPPRTFELTGETQAVDSMVTEAARQRSRGARWRRGVAGLTVVAVVGIAGAAAASPGFDAMSVPGFVRRVFTGDLGETVETPAAIEDATATWSDAVAVGPDSAAADAAVPMSTEPSAVPPAGPAGDPGASASRPGDPPACGRADRRSRSERNGLRPRWSVCWM